MLKINAPFKPRVSNRLAALGAVMLLVSSLAGIANSPMKTIKEQNQTVTDNHSLVDSLAVKSPGGNTHAKNKGFKMSLYLFRAN